MDDGAPPDSPDEGAPDPLVGHVLGERYRLERQIDSGGFSVVYVAEHLALERPVAVKVMRETYAATAELRARFGREGKALAALSHPNIVGVMDVGEDEGTPYLVMELLEGRTLKEVLDEGRVAPTRALHIIRQLLRAVAFVHSKDVIHRDLKPGNVFLQALPDESDHAKLLDFGFVKFLDVESGHDGRPLTREGKAFGTPTYMAPEQATTRDVDARVDVYAAGVILFEMLAGRKPFVGDAAEQLRTKLTDDAPSLGSVRTDVAIAPELESLLAKALAREPAQRYRTALGLLRAVDALPDPAVRPHALTAPTPAPTATAGRGLAARTAGVPPVFLAAAIAAPLLAVLVLCLGTSLLFAGGDEGEEVMSDGISRSAPTSADSETADLVFTEEEAFGPLAVPDPWTTRPVTGALADAHTRFSGGGDLDDSLMDRLRSWSRDNPDDARFHLLLGHVYNRRGWRSDALGQYDRAHEMDPAVRGDPHLLANLIAMTLHASVGNRAFATLRHVYGSEAVDAIDSALSHAELNGPQERRLTTVRERLTAE